MDTIDRELYILYAVYKSGKEIIAASHQPAVINTLFDIDRGRPIELVKVTYNEDTGQATEESIKYTTGSDIIWYWQ